ncbi:MAG: hypothetical protein CVU73_06200 [Deltaproteobacteria bacterium HGW-Deltaproteobacteria-8]|jgi:spore coat polysaccharide biosynthesis protein SpsF (cytidylyltransferase family)|nr:MAG: hypothetical protein CVU73_06200 [Deltaproteobacteria bacterium HGW-Deltaproteobacteria-8]
MSIGVIVQARMSSSRLPGKVLREVRGRALLGHLLDGLRQAKGPDTLLVATSVDPSDDAVEQFCRAEGARCWRGPLDDVAARFLGAAEAASLDAAVRICADSPLLDPALVDQAVALFRLGGADLVSNVLRRTYPKGQSVEVVSVEALRLAVRDMAEAEDREHVTRYLYARPERFAIRGFESGTDLGGVNMSVDTEADLARFAAVMARLARPHWEYGWRRLMELAGEGA